MTSWYSNILTKTTSQISSLRSTLLSGEADGDTEDDTHVCRVLRNYYTDKGRPLPPWLPPDPKAPAQQAPQTLYAQPQVGSRYGGLGQQAGGSSTGLSSLWDSGPSQQQQPAQPASLRAGRPPSQRQPPPREEVVPRPLPSQRAGSVQQPGGASAQDRLKQRLWGAGRTASPQQAGQSPFAPPGGSGSSYEDRFAPGGPPGGGQQRRQGLPSGPRGYR